MKKNIIIGLLCVALVAVGIWGASNNNSSASYKASMETSADKEYVSLMACAMELSNTLEKCAVSSDTAYTAEMLGQVSALAGRAQGLITGLPLSHIMSQSTVDYLSQAEEYAKYLSYRLIEEGGQLKEDEKESLKAMSSTALTFYNELTGFAEEIGRDEFSWYTKNSNFFFDEANSHFLEGFNAMEEGFASYPDINYDGKYSSHIENMKAKGLGEGDFTAEELLEKMKSGLGEEASSYEIKHLGDNASDIAASSYSVKSGNDEFILSYSATGGNLLSAASNIAVSESLISEEEAIKKAEAFVEKLGLKNMAFSRASNANNISTVKMVYVLDGVKCLSDSVSVQVSMADGRILGYEASDYYRYHDENRSIEQPKISAAQAAEKAASSISVNEVALALLQTDGRSEKLCYEITGGKDDMLYRIYIDAATGAERKIERIINGENGTSVF